jgi:ferredoxin-NADP reductase
VALVSAGVGLTPMISMLNAIVETGAEHAMGAHVRRLADENDFVHCYVRYSRPGPEETEGRDYDSEGHVDAALLERLLPAEGVDYYLCGPTPFLKSVFRGLLAGGVAEDRIHYEFFGPASALRKGDDAGIAKGDCVECSTEIEVTFKRSGVTGNWNPSFGTLLDMAEGMGLSPAYSCRSGICQTCICSIVGGEVEYVEEPLDPPDDDAVLICCSKPKTDVVIDA